MTESTETASQHEPAGWLVYFNGIEIPAVSVQVSGGVSRIPEARITLPPDVLMNRIGAEDRVRVSIFYYDIYYTATQGIKPDWRLLFDGEIVDYGYSKSAESRELYYIAVDMSAVLTQLFPMFISNVAELTTNEMGSGSSTVATTTSPLMTTFHLMNVGLGDNEIVRRPFDFVMNILRLLTGEGVPEGIRSVIATNWFAPWAKRTGFLRRFMASYDMPGEGTVNDGSGGFPILKAAQDYTAVTALANNGDRIAGNSGYYQLIQELFGRMYYDLNTILAPPYVQVNATTFYPVDAPTVSFDTGDSPEYVPLTPDAATYVPPIQVRLEEIVTEDPYVTLSRGTTHIIAQHVTQPKNFFGIPPRCNVFWPAMLLQHSFSENFAVQPTRTYIGNPTFLNLTNPDGSGGITEIAEHALTVGYPHEADRMLSERKITGNGKHETNVHNFLVFSEEFYKGPVYNQLNTPTWFSFLASSNGGEGARLQRLYAAMEHVRTRLSHRNGSVATIFNPYIITGQPCVTVDNEHSGQHVYGYAMSVSHNLSQTNMSTTVAYTYAQPFEDFFETMVKQRTQFPQEVDTTMFAPAHPLEELRTKFQTNKHAAEYFNRLYYNGKSSDPLFRWEEVFGVRRSDVEGNSSEELERIETLPQTSMVMTPPNSVSDDNTGYVPRFAVKPEYERYTKSPRSAMEYASRPVCTLEEYIDFHGDMGRREGLRGINNPTEGKVAPYYVKILHFRPGPGVEPGETVYGARCTTTDTDTRRNWETRFLRYRDKVYNQRHPNRA